METRDLISNYYDAFNRMDIEGFLNLLTEDVVHDISQGGREVGKTAFRKFLQVMDEHYEEKLTDLVIMVNADGTRAAAEFVIHGTYKKSQEGLPPARGQKYKIPVGAFFNISDGKVARISNHYNLNDWIKQVS